MAGIKGRTYSTSLGPVVIWGDHDRFRPGRPTLFMIRGILSPARMFAGLGENFPEVDFAFCDLPGIFTPAWEVGSIEAFGRAIDAALAVAFPDRDLYVFGLSMGGVAALHLRSPAIKAVIAVDPMISSGPGWPLRNMILRDWTHYDPRFRKWAWEILGYSPEGSVGRSYRGALEGDRPATTVLAGADPLEPERVSARMPSLVGREDRAALRACPGVSLIEIEGSGHDMVHDAPDALFAQLQRFLSPASAGLA